MLTALVILSEITLVYESITGFETWVVSAVLNHLNKKDN